MCHEDAQRKGLLAFSILEFAIVDSFYVIYFKNTNNFDLACPLQLSEGEFQNPAALTK